MSANEKDRIAETFQGRTILITGGSGFLGKVLIEKLLRCCSGIKRIYLLIRTKKEKTPQQRLNDIFNNVLFDKLKEQQPDALKKCKIIPGDVAQIDLGISAEDRRILQEEVEIIFHSAATVRFNEPVKNAIRINTRGTKYMLDLAKECKNLIIFVHVSTAYAFPKEKILYEKAYKASADVYEVLNNINLDTKEDEESEALLGDNPNTYTLSKGLAEQLVVDQMDKLPVIIVRPSVVCPAYREPIPGWANNLQGPAGLFVGAGKGVIRSMYMKSETHADFIPVDIAINAMLIITWDYINNKEDRFVNIASTSEGYRFSWEEIMDSAKDVIYNDLPFNGVLWYPGGSMKRSKLYHNICFYIFQIIPALIIDAFISILGYKPILYQIQRRIQKGCEVFEYYTTKSWEFNTTKAEKIKRIVNKTEREIYRIEVDGIYNMRNYLSDCILFIRRHILKQNDDMIPSARRNMKIMWIIDILCKLLFVLVFFYYISKWVFGVH